MHMADALLSPAVGGTLWAGALASIVYAARKLRDNMDERIIPLMGVLGAFIFAGQMINFTIPGTGSSGHIGGGMLLAILLGPYAAFLVIASVLTVQCLFFADGGLLALGANIWNLGIYPCVICYPLIYKPIVKKGLSSKRITVASIFSVIVALQLGALSVVLETRLSGITELPFSTFLAFMQPIHLAIGLVEGFITAGIVLYVKKVRPDIVEDIEGVKVLSSGPSMKKVLVVFAILAFITGGALSWFASIYPDGLEWSIEKISGSPELPERPSTVTENLTKLQEKTAVLPDYSLPSKGQEAVEPTWPSADGGTSLSGLLGSILVVGLVIIFGIAIRTFRPKKNNDF